MMVISLVNGAGLVSVTCLGDRLSRVLNLRVLVVHMVFEALGPDEVSW